MVAGPSSSRNKRAHEDLSWAARTYTPTDSPALTDPMRANWMDEESSSTSEGVPMVEDDMEDVRMVRAFSVSGPPALLTNVGCPGTHGPQGTLLRLRAT